MLGSAPGTDLLNKWVADADGGMSVDDLANHIADTSGFQADYPTFLTNKEFAESFLGNMLVGLSDELMMGAVDLVAGLLDSGLSRGSLALAVVDALYDINKQGMDHAAYADLGMSAMTFANKIEVATFHTLDNRAAGSSDSVLVGVTSDPATVAAAIEAIKSPPADAMFDAVGALSLEENADGSGMPGDDNGPIGVGHVTASDSNGDMVTYSIAGDPDDWAILEDGKLCYTGAGVDYEMGSSIDLEIIATSTGADGTETAVSQMVAVSIGDVRESDAVFDAVAALSIDENEAAGMVGSVTASDAEGDEVAYRLAEGSPAGFSIDAMTGAISYAGDGLDYEAASTVGLTVIATSIGANNMATDVSTMVTVQVGDVDDLPDEPMRFVLTPTIDDVMGGDANDTIDARPVAQVSSVFQAVLNPFDTIDGGGGVDTIRIFGVNPDDELSLGAEDISNVENVVINTVGGINADLTDWEGVSMVDLRRFGDDNDITVIVDDGATVSTTRTFGGDVTLVGAAGAVNIEATGGSNVVIGTGSHTESVTVKGGASVSISKNGASIADANAHKGGQSDSVTSVSVIGVAHNTGTKTPAPPSGTFDPVVNNNGFVVGQDGSTQVSITVGGSSGTATTPVGLDDDGVTLTNALAETAILGTYSWDDDGDASADTSTTALTVIAKLKFDVKSGGLVFGDIISINGTAFSATQTDITVRDGLDGEKSYKAGAIDGMRVPASVAYTSQDIGKKDADPGEDIPVGGGPTLTINSDAIADLALASTTATVLVYNNSMTEDEKAMPEDLAVTVDGYGSFKPGSGAPDVAGKLCVAGAGSAENIMITVAGASNVDLNSNVVKMLDISADAKLNLDVSKFAGGSPVGPSETLESVMVSGAGAVSMNDLTDMKKLASIDASMSSGNNSFKSGAELTSLTMVMGGSGNDTFQLGTSLRGRLETIDTGDGNDTVMMSGDYRDEGLMVALGSGNDTFHGNAGNEDSRIDGGDGRDTLRLSADGVTYKDGDDTKSIYMNFEILDVGGGQGAYNVGRLGVDTIVVNKDTADEVELNNVGGGTSLNVSAEKAGVGTKAEVDYNFAEDVNVAGSIIDGGTNNILNVSLTAKGGSGGTKSAPGPGAVELQITLDDDLLAMAIDSDASVHRTAAGKGVTSGHYQNKVTVGDTSSALKEVKITGDAMTELSGAGLTKLEYVNATESGGDVTVDASASIAKVRLVGGQGDDTLTAGTHAGATPNTANTLLGNGGDDTLVSGGAGLNLLLGGAGGDSLTGTGTSTDYFVYNAASESQVSFKRQQDGSYKEEGFDKITAFGTGTDKLHFSKALHAIVTAGGIKTGVEWDNGVITAADIDSATAGDLVGSGWMTVDDDGTPGGASTATVRIDGDGAGRNDGDNAGTPDGGATDLRSFIGNGKGLFMTKVKGQAGDFITTRDVKNSLAIIEQDSENNDTANPGDGLWLLIDVDGDGDFDGDTDMVIFLAGIVDSATGFVAGDISS